MGRSNNHIGTLENERIHPLNTDGLNLRSLEKTTTTTKWSVHRKVYLVLNIIPDKPSALCFYIWKKKYSPSLKTIFDFSGVEQFCHPLKLMIQSAATSPISAILEGQEVEPPCICLVLYDLHFWHLCATMWKWTSDVSPQSLQRIRTWTHTNYKAFAWGNTYINWCAWMHML